MPLRTQVAAIFALGLLFSAVACTTADESLGTDSNGCVIGYEAGLCAPDFTMPEASGEPVNLFALRGNIVLVASEVTW